MFVSISKWPAIQYATLMSINPINVDAAYNYTRVVEKLFNHTLVYDDDYVKDNLVEVHIYLDTNDIQYLAPF
jgi:hypothetical protein